MRANLHQPGRATDRVVLVGTGAPATTALWALAAAGAHVRWHVDRTDVGAETILASGLASRAGRGRVELSFDDARVAPLDGARAVVTARGDAVDQEIAARARASRVPVQVIGRPDLSTVALAAIDGAGGAWDGHGAPQIG
jgi:uroporphyrin-III C-methyltransferase/precorrin-2 dehydrogenase/sirohydrochlorin ferrochelatase